MKQPAKGLFVVIEGSDGSGKATQLNLLKERLKATGYEVAVFDFPQYSQESSYFVRQYLGGHYGSASKISPYTASLFYALDRYAASKKIKDALKDGKIVLSNRYTGANMAHQGGKFTDPVEQRSFFVWADNLEYQLLEIPRPDVNFFLRVPANISEKLIRQRAAKTGVQLDEHEKDSSHLRQALATYDMLCQLFPKDFQAIECTRDQKLLSVAEINNLIWDKLKSKLPADKPNPSHSVVVTLDVNESAADDSQSPPDELRHTFKDASLLLGLFLHRTGKAIIQTEFKKWSDNGYDFYTPQGLPKPIKETYANTHKQIAGAQTKLRSKMLKYFQTHMLSADNPHKTSVDELLLPLTPLSALADISFSIKKNDVQSVASYLLTQDIDELQWAAKQLYLAARHKWPTDFKGPLESSEGPVSLNNIIAKLAEERLPHGASADDSIKLLEARPRLEFDLLAESIYPYSNLSLDEIAEEVSNWPYSQKYDSLKQAASQPEVLKKVKYKLDILSDQLTLNKIFAAGHLKDIQIQSFTPRYGYEVPQVIELAAADDLYETCFDLCLKLYSLIQGAGREDLAPYATLLGHKVRWQLNLDANALHHITKSAALSSNRTVAMICEKIAESHPLLWEIVRNVRVDAIAPPKSKNGKNRVKTSSQGQTKRRGNNPKKP